MSFRLTYKFVAYPASSCPSSTAKHEPRVRQEACGVDGEGREVMERVLCAHIGSSPYLRLARFRARVGFQALLGLENARLF